jgi:integrase
MTRAIGRLKAIAVERAKTPGLLADGGGLYLRIGKGSGKSWVFRYRRDGKLHDMGLGPAHTVSLAEAREAAHECRKMRLDRIDPIEARQASRREAMLTAASALTFRECAERYIEAHKAGWRNAVHAEQWPASLAAYAYPVFGELPIQAIDVALVMKAIEPLWQTKTETANRTRGRIENILDWAKARGYRIGENPARWKGHLDKMLPRRSKVRAVEHHAALPYPQIAGLMAELRQQEGIAYRALEFTILTAVRSGEARGARWSEIDRDAKVWNIPAARMKGGRAHRVPLSDAALAVLDAMAEIRQSDFVFAGTKLNRSLGKEALSRTLIRMGRTDTTVHGLRSTFRDWCADCTTFQAEIAEAALAHQVGDAVERAYRRSDLFDRRRQMMDQWARFCSGPAGGEVIPLIAMAR